MAVVQSIISNNTVLNFSIKNFTVMVEEKVEVKIKILFSQKTELKFLKLLLLVFGQLPIDYIIDKKTGKITKCYSLLGIICSFGHFAFIIYCFIEGFLILQFNKSNGSSNKTKEHHHQQPTIGFLIDKFLLYFRFSTIPVLLLVPWIFQRIGLKFFMHIRDIIIVLSELKINYENASRKLNRLMIALVILVIVVFLHYTYITLDILTPLTRKSVSIHILGLQYFCHYYTSLAILQYFHCVSLLAMLWHILNNTLKNIFNKVSGFENM